MQLKKLPREISEAMQALKTLHNTPESMSLQIALGVINCVVAPRYQVDSGQAAGYGMRPTVLFFMNLADTGGGKSTNFNELSGPYQNYQQMRQDSLRNEPTRYALDRKLFDKQQQEYLKDPQLNPVPQEPRPQETAKYILNATTLNGMIDILQGQAHTSVFTDEGGTFFAGHSFQKTSDKSTEMISNLTRFWDGTTVERNTGHSSITLPNRRVNMLILAQERVLRPVLNNPVFSEQGFLHRFLITQSEPYTRPDIDVSPERLSQQQLARQQIAGFHARLEQMLRQPIRQRLGYDYQLEFATVKMQAAAERLLSLWFNATKNLAEEGQKLARYAGFAHRLHEMALRLAANIAVFQGQTEIAAADMESALELMDYYVEQRRRLDVGVEQRDNEPAVIAERITNWIRERKFMGTLSELQRFGPSWWRTITIDSRRRVMDGLVEDEVLTVSVVVSPKNGKTSVIYSLA